MVLLCCTRHAECVAFHVSHQATGLCLLLHESDATVFFLDYSRAEWIIWLLDSAWSAFSGRRFRRRAFQRKCLSVGAWTAWRKAGVSVSCCREVRRSGTPASREEEYGIFYLLLSDRTSSESLDTCWLTFGAYCLFFVPSHLLEYNVAFLVDDNLNWVRSYAELDSLPTFKIFFILCYFTHRIRSFSIVLKSSNYFIDSTCLCLISILIGSYIQRL